VAVPEKGGGGVTLAAVSGWLNLKSEREATTEAQRKIEVSPLFSIELAAKLGAIMHFPRRWLLFVAMGKIEKTDGMSDADLVEVAFSNDPAKAGMIQGLLENGGIPSLLLPTGLNGPLLGVGLLPPGPQRVMPTMPGGCCPKPWSRTSGKRCQRSPTLCIWKTRREEGHETMG
jgi:hypothetical protein